jgi:hypothetical protein
VEVRHRRRVARRRGLKACCLIGSAIRVALRTRCGPAIRGNGAVVRLGANGAVYKEWCRSLGALPFPNAGQWLGSTPAGCEVCRAKPAETRAPPWITVFPHQLLTEIPSCEAEHTAARPTLRREESSCQLGAVHTRGEAEVGGRQSSLPRSIVTHCGHSPERNPAVQRRPVT